MKKWLPKFQNSGTVPDRNFSKMPKPDPIKGTIQATKEYGSGAPPKKSFSEVEVDKERKREVLSQQRKQNRSLGNPGGLSEEGLSTMGGIASAAGGVTDMLSSAVNADENSSFKQQQMVGDALMKSGNPYAMIAGVALKAGSAMDQALGTNINTISKDEAKATGISGAGRLLNNVLGFLPTGGMGALVGKTDSVRMSDETRQLSNAFAGSVQDISTAEGMSGGRYLVGKNKINSLIQEAQRSNRIIADLNTTNTTRKMSDYGQDLAQQNLNRFAGNNYQNVHIGKSGLKLISAEEIRTILNARRESDVEKFQNGGIMSGNVLPTGKLHKELHHIDDVNPELAEDLTRKGIPVVAINEDGDFEEVAEIERDEWTTSKEVTEKLESLWKDGSEEAMLECGKFICEQLLQFTRDDNNIIWENEKQQQNL